MTRTKIAMILLVGLLGNPGAKAGEPVWNASAPIFQPGPAGAFDAVAVKDPSVVFAEGNWHLFYTARSAQQYSLGYAAAPALEGLSTAKRHPLSALHGKKSPYAAAPQVFFFAPRNLWCLVFQTRDANYQAVISTTKTIAAPESWSAPEPMTTKSDTAKWIDFWVLCDERRAYLYFTRDHKEVCVMETDLARFPQGFGNPQTVFSPVHEAVHVYKVAGKTEFHMVCEYRDRNDLRHFGLASAPHPLGPWKMTEETYAVGGRVVFPAGAPRWTGEVSHGEMIRTGCDQRLEYDAAHPRVLIQGLPEGAHTGAYESLPWALGLLAR